MPDYQYAAVFEPAEEGGYIVTGRSRDSSSFRTSHCIRRRYSIRGVNRRVCPAIPPLNARPSPEPPPLVAGGRRTKTRGYLPYKTVPLGA
jgi:hypothetical protein